MTFNGMLRLYDETCPRVVAVRENDSAGSIVYAPRVPVECVAAIRSLVALAFKKLLEV